MSEFKEFNGGSINEAIAEACAFFGVEREKLEVDILSEGKSGIFGLVGARPAVVRARRYQRPADAVETAVVLPEQSVAEPEQAPPLPDSDQTAQAQKLAVDILNRLLAPIADNPSFDVSQSEVGHVRIKIDVQEDSGLLIGRDGQTLMALQYLTSRILARQCPGGTRVELDSKAYREQRDESLKVMALRLAEKVKAEGRAQSTKPLSSGHRRIVHMALNSDSSIRTRSQGEGDLKRVVIALASRAGSRDRVQQEA